MKIGDHLKTERLLIRNWNKVSDGDAFFTLNNDPSVMRFFPGRRTRDESDALLDAISMQQEKHGYGWSAICLQETGEVIGFGGIAPVEESFPNGPSTEIGWRFLPQFWGQGYATEMAQAMLAYGFDILNLKQIFAFAVSDNKASLAVMRRIGMERAPSLDFDHPRVEKARYPQLVRHQTHKMDFENWEKQKRPV